MSIPKLKAPMIKNKHYIKAMTTAGAVKRTDNLTNKEYYVYPEIMKDKFQVILDIFDTPLVAITATINPNENEHLYFDAESASLLGRYVAHGEGRDSGAKIPNHCDVFLMSGEHPTTGGSAKNWLTILKKDSVFLFSVPKGLYDYVIKMQSMPYDDYYYNVGDNEPFKFSRNELEWTEYHLIEEQGK